MKKLIASLATVILLTPFTGRSQSGAPADHSTIIEFQTLDGNKARAYYVPSDSATGNVLIIYHDLMGLTTDVKKEAQKWKAMLGNIDVYAIDMYDGKMTYDRNLEPKYREELNTKHTDNITRGLLSKIGPDKRIITMGWGVGGRRAFRAAMIAGNQTVGCIMYYSVPEKEDKNIRGLNGDVLYNWASGDKYVQKAFVDDFGRKVQDNKRKFEMHVLNADPGFAYPYDPSHDALATAEADRYSLVFIKAKFQIE